MVGANNAQGQFSCQGNFNGRCARQAQGTGHKAKAIKENLSFPYALCLTPYALRLTPYALRLIFKLRLSANFSYIFPLKVKKVNFCT
jgi:hypothetical protein